ncbi:hypothetical protein Naga_100951g1 [Nannochloropsis gaditana]|uniref:Uncharacterized protein n=1 Tax=Nannochloropsis gaditana TaxID=72520 RepID=W7TK50_9STRA|nr:hypothetical protein Naga_100951g1 [Nannochloropsis gaditana]
MERRLEQIMREREDCWRAVNSIKTDLTTQTLLKKCMACAYARQLVPCPVCHFTSPGGRVALRPASCTGTSLSDTHIPSVKCMLPPPDFISAHIYPIPHMHTLAPFLFPFLCNYLLQPPLSSPWPHARAFESAAPPSLRGPQTGPRQPIQDAADCRQTLPSTGRACVRRWTTWTTTSRTLPPKQSGGKPTTLPKRSRRQRQPALISRTQRPGWRKPRRARM